MKFAALCRWVFNVAAAVSLICCLTSAALWARSVGHFEMINWRCIRWNQANELEIYDASLSWYPNTFRIGMDRQEYGPEYFEPFTVELMARFRDDYPGGGKWAFIRKDIATDLKWYKIGFHAEHRLARSFTGDATELGVRPFLPTLLAAILPAVWLIQYRRRHGVLWKFGLRELLFSVTTIAALLGAALWLVR